MGLLKFIFKSGFWAGKTATCLGWKAARGASKAVYEHRGEIWQGTKIATLSACSAIGGMAGMAVVLN